MTVYKSYQVGAYFGISARRRGGDASGAERVRLNGGEQLRRLRRRRRARKPRVREHLDAPILEALCSSSLTFAAFFNVFCNLSTSLGIDRSPVAFRSSLIHLHSCIEIVISFHVAF